MFIINKKVVKNFLFVFINTLHAAKQSRSKKKFAKRSLDFHFRDANKVGVTLFLRYFNTSIEEKTQIY